MNENILNRITIILDGNSINTREDFFSQLKQQLGEDVLIGSNLDALYDVLSSSSSTLLLEFNEVDKIKDALGAYWNSLYNMLMDVIDENTNISLSFNQAS